MRRLIISAIDDDGEWEEKFNSMRAIEQKKHISHISKGDFLKILIQLYERTYEKQEHKQPVAATH